MCHVLLKGNNVIVIAITYDYKLSGHKITMCTS